MKAASKINHSSTTPASNKQTEQPDSKINQIANAALPRTLGQASLSSGQSKPLPRIEEEPDVSKSYEPAFEIPRRKKVEGHHGLPTCDSELLRQDGKI